MADKVLIEVILTDKGTIKGVSTDLKKFNKTAEQVKSSFSNVSKAANKTKRNFEGVAERSNRAGKDFGRMAQGMGGLVQAYATIAANVFALSSAFLVLRRAADLSSMIKSAEDFSNRFGVSVTRLTKRMQELSGGALDFAQALPSINKAISAGVGIEQMEKLTVAATKAAQTFGGSTSEALNRFISASQRGRVEIIQTLGVVIKTEQAYKDYGASIGKTAQELTAFDRQQAILNATIAESEKVFGAINIDPNPFQRLATTIVDLKNKYLTAITDAITPGINTFNRSADAARAFMLVIASAVAGRIFPQLTVLLKGVQAASIKSTAEAARAEAKALKLRQDAAKEHAKVVGATSQKSIRKQIMMEEAAYAKRDKMHADFKQSIFNREGKIDRARLTAQRAALQRQLNAIEKRGGKGSTDLLSKDTNVLREQIRLRNSLTSATQNLGIAEAKATAARAGTTTAIKKLTTTLKSYNASLNATFASIRSNLVTGFSKGFVTAQATFVKGVGLMYRDWRVFIRSIGRDGSNSVKLFSNAFGRMVGTVAGGLAKLASLASSVVLWWSLINLGIEIFGDRIKGITPEQRKLVDTFQDSGKALEEIVERNKNFIAGFDKGQNTVQSFIETTEFLRGTLDSLKTTFNDVSIAFNRAFGLDSATDLTTYIKGLEAAADRIDELRRQGTQQIKPEAILGGFDISDVPTRISREDRDSIVQYTGSLKEVAIESENAAKTLTNVNNIISEMGQTFIPQVIAGLSSTTQLLSTTGFDLEAQKISNAIASAVANFSEAPAGLAEAFSAGRFIEAQAILENLRSSGEEGAKNAAILLALIAESGDKATTSSKAVFNNFVGFSRSLQTINSNMQTYISGIEKAKSASVPNKEALNFIIDTRIALEGLRDTSEGTSNNLKTLVNAEDLKSLRLFFDIPESVEKYSEALQIVINEQEKYNKVVQDSISKANIFKAISNQVAALKLEEADTDERRIKIIRELFDLENERLDNQIRIAENAKAVALVDLRRIERANRLSAGEATNNIAVIQAREKVSSLELDIEATKVRRLRNTDKEELEVAREEIKIREESLTTSKGVLKARQGILAIERKLTSSIWDYLSVSEKIYKSNRLNLRLRAETLELELEALSTSGKTLQQQEKDRAVLEARLDLIKQETRELERQQESRLALQLEQEGTTVFTERGLKESAKFFKRELEKEVLKLKSTFETLGRGFAKVIDDTFDAAVDNLLEGGRDFGHIVIETLKAGLREVFGEAIKAKIQEAFSLIFKSDKEEKDPVPEKLDTQINILTKIEGNTRNTGSGNTSIIAGAVTESKNPLEGLFDSVIKAEIPSVEDVLKDILISTGEGADATKSGFLKTVQTLFTLIQAVLTGAASKVGEGFKSIFSIFGFAKGGIIDKGITPMASGYLANKPTLGLIGEGKTAEAVVPLPNNREIPVEMRGSSGDTIQIEQHFDFRNADASAIPKLRAEARAIEERTFNRVFSEINKGGAYAKMVGRR